MVRFSEHELGKGTLGYKGETEEYYESKRGIWDVFRWVLAAVLLVVGTAFLVAAASPIVTAQVTAVSDNAGSGTNQVTLVAPDGTASTVTMSYAQTPAVGSTQVAMHLPGGRLVPGDYSVQGRAAGLLLVGIGAAIALWAVWRMVRPVLRTRPVTVPDDTYARGPRS